MDGERPERFALVPFSVTPHAGDTWTWVRALGANGDSLPYAWIISSGPEREIRFFDCQLLALNESFVSIHGRMMGARPQSFFESAFPKPRKVPKTPPNNQTRMFPKVLGR